MPTPTEYHELDRFELDERPWSHTDTVETVDEEVPKSGLIAGRPSSPPTGRRYWATDERVLYRYDPDNTLAEPSGWVPIAGLGTDARSAGSMHVDDLQVDGRAGIGMAPKTAPLEIRGNDDIAFHIILHTLNDAGTTQEERAGILFNDDSGNRLANIAAHTHNNGHHFTLYGYDDTGTGFKAFDVESNRNFNFSGDLAEVYAKSPLRAHYEGLTGLILRRTDGLAHRINMVNNADETMSIRQVSEQLRLEGNGGAGMFYFNTNGPNRSLHGLEVEGDLTLGPNFLTFEEFTTAGSTFDAWANNGALRVRDPNNLNVLYAHTGGDVEIPNGDVTVPTGDVTVPSGGVTVGGETSTQTAHFPPATEPATPASGCVRWYDETAGALKVKFDNGTVTTLATK